MKNLAYTFGQLYQKVGTISCLGILYLYKFGTPPYIIWPVLYISPILIDALCWVINYKLKRRKHLQVLLNPSWYDGNRKYGVISMILLVHILCCGQSEHPDKLTYIACYLSYASILSWVYFNAYINSTKYNLPLLNSINWDIRLSFSDGFNSEYFVVEKMKHLAAYLISISRSAKSLEKIKASEQQLEDWEQSLKQANHKYDHMLEQMVDIRKDNSNQLEQELHIIKQGIERSEQSLKQSKEMLRVQKEDFNRSEQLTKQIKQKLEQSLGIYVKHLSDAELDEFRAVFLDYKALDKV